MLRSLVDESINRKWEITPCHIYHLYPSCKLPETMKRSSTYPEADILIEPLGLQWTNLLVDSWKFTDEKTDHMMRTLISLGRVFGVFLPELPEPVSWMVIYSDGSIGMLK